MFTSLLGIYDIHQAILLLKPDDIFWTIKYEPELGPTDVVGPCVLLEILLPETRDGIDWGWRFVYSVQERVYVGRVADLVKQCRGIFTSELDGRDHFAHFWQAWQNDVELRDELREELASDMIEARALNFDDSPDRDEWDDESHDDEGDV